MLILSLLLAACVPFPHKAFRTPFVYGKLDADAETIANARVRAISFPESESCSGRHMIEGTVKDDGFFLVCPDPDFQMFIAVMVHTAFEWNVCIYHDDQWQLVHQGQQYTLVDTGPRTFVELPCSVEGADLSCNEVVHPAYAGSPIPWETIEPFGCKWVEPSSEE